MNAQYQNGGPGCWMKSCLVIIALSLWLVGPATAGVLRGIDPSQTADVSGKTVTLPNADLNKTIALPTRDLPTAPVSTKQHETRGTIETRSVDLSTLELRQVETATRRFPQSNFTAKRAAITDHIIPGKTVPTGAAPVTNRVIRTGTPAEQDELRQQLKHP